MTATAPEGLEVLGQYEQLAARLTERQRDVLALIAEGATTRQIAERLELGEKTVETHRGAILKRLELRNAAAATAWLFRLRALRLFGEHAGVVCYSDARQGGLVP